MAYFKTVEDIRKSNETIKRNSGTLQDRIQKTVNSATYLFFSGKIDGEVYAELMTETNLASPYHAKAVAKWIDTMTPLNWSKEKKVWYAHKNAKIKEEQFKAAVATPFWKVSPPPTIQPMNLLEELDKVVARADKRTEDKTKGTDQDSIPGALVREMKTLLSKFHAAEYEEEQRQAS